MVNEASDIIRTMQETRETSAGRRLLLSQRPTTMHPIQAITRPNTAWLPGPDKTGCIQGRRVVDKKTTRKKIF